MSALIRVSFVCTGNICRSPMADVVMRHVAAATPLPDGTDLSRHVAVSSAGTTAWHAGERMDRRAAAALRGRGYADHGHRARGFDADWFGDLDLVVCMDRGHLQALGGLAGATTAELALFRSYDPAAGSDLDVPDPYDGEQADFEACLTLVEAGCRGLAVVLADRVQPAGSAVVGVGDRASDGAGPNDGNDRGSVNHSRS